MLPYIRMAHQHFNATLAQNENRAVRAPVSVSIR